jgi:hypothetical protein
MQQGAPVQLQAGVPGVCKLYTKLFSSGHWLQEEQASYSSDLPSCWPTMRQPKRIDLI